MRTPNKSRSRNKNNRRNNNSGGNVLNRVYDSAGPDGRVRGTPVQVIEKYQALAHDHSLAGDRVAMENFQQHAEHYIRLINEAQKQIAERREQMDNQNRPNADDGNNSNRQQPRAEADSGKPVDSVKVDPAQADQPDLVEAKPARGKDQRPNRTKEQNGEKAETASPLVADGEAAAPDAGGLVETPEDGATKPKASKPRRPRRPKQDAAPQDEAAGPAE